MARGTDALLAVALHYRVKQYEKTEVALAQERAAVANVLHRARVRLDLSLREAAKLVGISAPALVDIESGTHVSSRIARRLVMAYAKRLNGEKR